MHETCNADKKFSRKCFVPLERQSPESLLATFNKEKEDLIKDDKEYFKLKVNMNLPLITI